MQISELQNLNDEVNSHDTDCFFFKTMHKRREKVHLNCEKNRRRSLEIYINTWESTCSWSTMSIYREFQNLEWSFGSFK